LLQKAVSGALHFKVVKTQTNTLSRFINGVGAIDFAGNHELLISAAKILDTKNQPHMMIPSEYHLTCMVLWIALLILCPCTMHEDERRKERVHMLKKL
jgi:hypothetical protein